jgi:hypothetical protein
MAISKLEIGACLNFFNQGGYVLDFSTNDFDNFTGEVVGVFVCSKYHLSKGKSLTAYTVDAPEQDVIKLFAALIEHYELSPEYDRDKEYDQARFRQYEKCKAIIDRASNGNATSLVASQIKKEFDSEYINAQIQLMITMQEENPTESIGKAKELIESCCKTILEKVGVTINSKWDMPNLVDEVFKYFKIMPRDIDENIKGAKSIRQILGNLKAMAQGIIELRNIYGSGHGKAGSYKGLEPRHAQLAVGSSITLVNFMWDSYKRNYIKM